MLFCWNDMVPNLNMLGLTRGPLTLMEIRGSSMLIFISRRQQFECRNTLCCLHFCRVRGLWVMFGFMQLKAILDGPSHGWLKKVGTSKYHNIFTEREPVMRWHCSQSLWICLSRSQRKGPIWHNNSLWNNAMFRNNHKPFCGLKPSLIY